MFRNAVEVLDVSGFRIRVDPSWLLIAALVIWSLAAGYFPGQVPGLSASAYIALGTVAMLLLFFSLVVHELAHSFMARRFGLNVSNITLFLFGGVAELDEEPRSPKSEFWIAIVGPITSLAIGLFSWVCSRILGAAEAPTAVLAVLDYLALVNVVVAIFNLIPAFPLDGGRVFRAALWHFKGDLVAATSVASSFGTALGFLLIVAGVFSLFSTSAFGGLWQILIGFFVVTASRGSYQQLLVTRALKNQTVASLLSRPVYSADAGDSIQKVIDNVILKHNVTFVPVTDAGKLLGYVTVGLLQGIDRENWNETCLGDVYVARGAENTVAEDTPTQTLFSKMAANDQRKFMVADGDTLVGVIALSDLMTFLSIQSGLGLKTMAERSKRN